MSEIPLLRGQVALVDDEDYEMLVAYGTWRIASGVYAGMMRGGRTILMHRVILGPQAGQEIDHINMDGLDNRRSNLRLATKSQNGIHRPKPRPSASRYKGVGWWRRDSCWRVKIGHGGRHVGYFANEDDAAHAYDAEAIRTYGAFAWLNFPEDHP
jgi:AP2 domain.